MRNLSTFEIAACAMLSIASSVAVAAEDVMLQTLSGQVVTGLVDDESGVGELGARVFRGNFLSNFRAANPGFFSLASVNPNLPDGASGFPSQHDVRFDLLPMRVGSLTSNLLYWDGTDSNGDGLDLADVAWVSPADVTWQVVDGNSATKTAAGTDEIVAGGLVQRTSSDTNPGDGVDTGLLHKHIALLLNQTAGGTPPPGVYAIAWRAYSDTFAASDPFVFVHRTSTVGNPVRDLAAQWVETHLDLLFPQQLPGDFNDDGRVDAADYTVWRDSLHQQGTSLPADGNGDEIVDAADYELWRQHFGEHALSGFASTTGQGAGSSALTPAAHVPEPATIASLGLVAVVAMFTRCRGWRSRRGPGSARPRR
jgi:hypothetical protein